MFTSGGVLEGTGVGSFTQGGLEEAFRFAVGARRTGPSTAVFEAELSVRWTATWGTILAHQVLLLRTGRLRGARQGQKQIPFGNDNQKALHAADARSRGGAPGGRDEHSGE